jgi:hypothetical protein
MSAHCLPVDSHPVALRDPTFHRDGRRKSRMPTVRGTLIDVCPQRGSLHPEMLDRNFFYCETGNLTMYALALVVAYALTVPTADT